jgi:serine protease DegS
MRRVPASLLVCLSIGFVAGNAAAQFESARRAVTQIEVIDAAYLRAREIMDRKISTKKKEAELRQLCVKQPFRLLVSGVAVSANEIVMPAVHPTASLHIIVRLRTGQTFKAEVVGNDPRSNLALIRINARTADYLPLVADNVKDRQLIALIGHRQKLASVGRGLVTHSRLGVRCRDIYGVRNGRSVAIGAVFVAAGTPRMLNPGSACLDEQGKLVGVILGCAPSQAIRGAPRTLECNFVIPSRRIAKIIDCMRKHGRVIRATFGMSVAAIPEALHAQLPDLPSGAGTVVHVEPKGPAGRAGLRRYDVVVSIDGKAPRDIYELRESMSDCHLKKKATVRVLRAGKKLEFAIEPTELK